MKTPRSYIHMKEGIRNFFVYHPRRKSQHLWRPHFCHPCSWVRANGPSRYSPRSAICPPNCQVAKSNIDHNKTISTHPSTHPSMHPYLSIHAPISIHPCTHIYPSIHPCLSIHPSSTISPNYDEQAHILMRQHRGTLFTQPMEACNII